MAQAKSSSRARTTGKRAAAKRSSSSARARSTNRSKGSSAASNRRTAGASSKRSASSRNGKGRPETVKATLAARAQNTKGKVADGAKATGNALGTVVEKSKGPAMAGGAALAGLAGGLAIASRAGRRRVLGVPIPGTRRPVITVRRARLKSVGKDLVKAAGEVRSAGQQAGELAQEVRLVREQLQGKRR